MAEIQIGSAIGSALNDLLTCGDIQPGDQPSYELCKTIMAYHPLGAKMTDSPIALAQSQKRQITVQDGPEDRLVEAFEAQWERDGWDGHIFNVGRQSRGYGISSIALLSQGTPADRPMNLKELWDEKIGVNVFDPLNTAGSLTLNQDPNSLDFQKVVSISAAGVPYHRSRSVTLQNENPLYIEWTASAYGFTGRSVFQRALYPLRSFIRSMITDDLVLVKAGVLVAKMKPPGSIVNQAMEFIAGIKRNFVKEAVTGNVIGITPDEDISTLDFTNLGPPMQLARKDVLDNIATAADMPAVLLNQETFAEGFGEGTEDAKRVSQYINRIREWLNPVYRWADEINMHRAWNPDFYRIVQKDFPEKYGNVAYAAALQKWKNSYKAIWPNLLEEPDSEKIKVDDVKLKAVIAALEVLAPMMDPVNKSNLIRWVQDCFNERKALFPSPLDLDFDALESYVPQPMDQVDPAPPFSGRDSDPGRVMRAMAQLSSAVAELPDLRRVAQQRRLERAA